MLKGVIFDMDGTITVPYIDWKTLRKKIGATPGQTLLEYIDCLPPDRSVWANDELLRAEMEAAQNADANDGIIDLVDHLRSKGMRLAVVTNNHREAMQTVLKRYGLRFDITLSREDGEIKPSGDLIEKALDGLGLSADEAIFIGDGRYDIEASLRVGIRCIYLTNGAPSLDHTPAIETLKEVLGLIEDAEDSPSSA